MARTGNIQHWVGVLAGVAMLVMAVGLAWGYRPGSTVPAEDGALVSAGLAAVALAAILSLVALVGRFRGSSGATRQQFKWILWGATILITTMIVGVILDALVGSRFEEQSFVAWIVSVTVFVGSYGIAVGRYRLYDIDVVISRTVVYGTVVALLVGVYAAAVFFLRELLPGGSDLAVAASTLAVAALFNPLRKRVQRLVDRRFYRSRYDAQRIVEEFSSRLRSEVDLTQLTAQWLDTVDRAVKPFSATVWIRPSNGRATRTSRS